MSENDLLDNGEPMFTPVRVGRAGEDVALQIEAAIISGRINPGDRLPSERELQMQFKTGRGVIREALRALKQKDLIEIRKGARGGAFVKQVDVANVSESLALYLKQHRVSPEYIIEFRESIDRAITSIAIARGTVEEKKALVEGALSLKEYLQQDDPDMTTVGEMDRDLNIQLARMTHNPVYEWIMGALQLGFSSYDYALYEDAEFRMQTLDNWVETAKDIQAGEPVKALASITMHYVLLRKRVEKIRVHSGPGEAIE